LTRKQAWSRRRGKDIFEIPKDKFQIPMGEVTKKDKVFDLEERTFLFAKNVRLMIKGLPKSIELCDDAKQ
jgi:hypothetical protein